MKRAILLSVVFGLCTVLGYRAMAQDSTPAPSSDQNNGAQCQQVRKEMWSKLKAINQEAEKQMKDTRQAFKNTRHENCWKNNKGNLDAIKSCLTEKQKEFDTNWDKLKTIQDQRFQNIISLLDTYSAQLKGCPPPKGRDGGWRGKNRGQQGNGGTGGMWGRRWQGQTQGKDNSHGGSGEGGGR